MVTNEDIERARAGDRDCERSLGERLLPIIQASIARRLYPLARARGRDPLADRDDFVSGVWLRLFEDDWKVLRAYDPARGSIEAYVGTIADRHVLSVFRIKSRDPYGEIPLSEDELGERLGSERDVEARAWARDELDGLLNFLSERLDERGLLLFDMLEIDQLPVAEVCDRARMSRDALYQWRTRVRRLVRQWRIQHS